MLVLDETPYQDPKEILQVAPTGIAKAAGMAALKLPVDVAAAATLIAGGVDELVFGRDNFFKLYDEEIKPIQDKLTPDPGSVSTAGRAISTIAGFAPALLTGAGAIPILAGQAAINEGANLVEQGVDAKTATGAGVMVGASTVAMAGIPAAGKTWGKTFALAALNPVIGAASTEAEKKLLEAGGYEDIAKQYDPLDPVARGIDAVMGVAFGSVAKYGTARREMLTKTKDSIDTIQNWQRMFKDTPFDITDPKSTDLGFKAMQKALTDISEGRPVDLSGVVPDNVKVADPAAPVRQETHEARQAVEAAGRAYQSIDAPTPRDIYTEELRQKNKGQVPDEHLKTVAQNEDLNNAGMPGWFDPKYYKPYIENLWKWHQETEIPVSRADLDIGHVTGMNDTLGHFETDKHLNRISAIVKETFEAHGLKDAVFSRYGGDELAVEAVGVPRDVLDKAAQDAKIRVDQYAKENGLLQLVSKKNPKPKDVTLHVNTVDFGAFDNYDEMRLMNDAKINNRQAVEKGAVENELRNQTPETRPVAPGGEPAGGVRRNEEDPGRVRSEAGRPETAEAGTARNPSAAEPAAEVAPAPGAATGPKYPKEVLPITDSQRLSLERVRDYIAQGEAPIRRQTDYDEATARGETPIGPWQRFEPNPFPDYFKGKGYKKKETLGWIAKALSGEPLTEKQRGVVQDLMQDHRAKIARQFMDARSEMRGYGDLWNDPSVQYVEQRLAEGGDTPIRTGTDMNGAPIHVSTRDFLEQAKQDYKALEAQKDIYQRISDCL